MSLSARFCLLLAIAWTSGNLSGCGFPTPSTQINTQASQPFPVAASPGAFPVPFPTAPPPAPRRTPDVIYVPTPQAAVDEMLRMARVNKDDLIYDLGSGDGRIVITAAKEYGARGIGIDIDPNRIREARANARKAGVADRVKFIQQDLFTTDFSKATVVTLYLLPSLNLKLRPQLFKQLKPGTRIVSHEFDMGNWKPERVVEVNGSTLYYWEIPAKIPENLR